MRFHQQPLFIFEVVPKKVYERLNYCEIGCLILDITALTINALEKTRMVDKYILTFWQQVKVIKIEVGSFIFDSFKELYFLFQQYIDFIHQEILK